MCMVDRTVFEMWLGGLWAYLGTREGRSRGGGLETRDVNTLNSSEASQRQTASSAMSRPCCGPEVVPPLCSEHAGSLYQLAYRP